MDAVVTVTRGCNCASAGSLRFMREHPRRPCPVNRDPPKPIVTDDQQTIVTVFSHSETRRME